MPIRPENKARYPKDWKKIRARILERATIDGIPHCEDCGVPNHEWIERTEAGWKLSVPDLGGIYIVLTIAHLDHIPENNSDDNLRAWCQRCHNRYDAPMRAAGIKARRKALNADGDLFE
jgi:5-methylcytosine-specific restriction endonuclease McrA